MWGSEGGGEVEAGWDWCPWGVAGGGEGIPHPEEERGAPLGGQRIKRERGQVSLAHLGPQEPTEIQDWSSAHWGPLQPHREGEREGGAKVKAGPLGQHPWGVSGGGSSYTQRDPPRVRGPAVIGETLGRCGGTEGNGTNTFPVHLGTGEPVDLPGLILCPLSLPPATQNPSPAATPPPRTWPLHLETPSALRLNPTHTPSLRALSPTPELHTQ